MNTTLFLVALSGICWTVVYVDAIRIGFRNKLSMFLLNLLPASLQLRLVGSILKKVIK